MVPPCSNNLATGLMCTKHTHTHSLTLSFDDILFMSVAVSTIKHQLSGEDDFFHKYERPIFTGLRSDSLDLSYVCWGLPGSFPVRRGLADRSSNYTVMDFIRSTLAMNIHKLVAVWRSGNGVRRINEVTLRRARLAPGWVTAFCGRAYHLGINQPHRLTRPPTLSGMGNKYRPSRGDGLGNKGRMARSISG